MSDALTREEFEDCVSSTSNCKRGLVLAHDAAQRARIAELEQGKRIADALMLEGSQKIDELRLTKLGPLFLLLYLVATVLELIWEYWF